MKKLDLADNDIQDEGAIALSQMLQLNTSIEELVSSAEHYRAVVNPTNSDDSCYRLCLTIS